MSNSTINLVILDDKSVTTHLDRAGYRQMGVQVRSVSTYDELRRAMSNAPADVIVINSDYKKCNPMTVVTTLKKDTATSEVPIVVTSVRSELALQKKYVEAGVALFVEQPVPRDIFIEKIKQILEQSTRTDERVEIDETYVVLRLSGQEEIRCQIADLSSSGMLLSTEREFPAGAPVELEFSLPEFKKPLRIAGVVVRRVELPRESAEKAHGVGVRFQDFSGDSQKRLERYLARSASRDLKMVYYL